VIVVLYDTETGRALSIASAAPAAVPSEMSVYTIDVPYGQVSRYEWNADTRELEVRGVSARVVLTKLEFASRLSMPEQVAVEMAKESADPQTRATLRVLDANLARATEIVLTDQRTMMGAQIIVQVLVAAGLVQPADQATRIAAMLAPIAAAPEQTP
jgi:hypothetical protein